MSAEETELTFIYCPGCRSLIPANASRCKMCGHALKSAEDKKNQTQQNEMQNAASAEAEENRPRQSTASISAEEVDRVYESEAVKPVMLEKPPAVAPVAQPVSAAPVAPREERKEERKVEMPVQSSNGQTREIPRERPAAEQKPSQPQQSSGMRFGGRERDVLHRDPQAAPAGSQARDERRQENRRDDRQDENSENRRDKKKKNRDDRAEFSERQPNEARHEQRNDRPRSDQPRNERNDQPRKEVREEVMNNQREARQNFESQGESRFEQRQEPQRQEPRREAPVVQQQRPQQAPAAPVAPAVQVAEGVLVGWFVRWDGDAKGSSREIRSGRYFISGEQLRPTDLVIAEAGLSVPHCLMRAGNGSLMIQDLMSESGTEIKRANGGFQSVDEACAVQHGDIVRFGDFEVMVCLLPIRPVEKSRSN